ncbi:UNVERIFIED_CONTAM: protein MAINTENANCE OF PSII UNDER HIGH LIGHT 1 [Sesamum calycinum]|uniref:Protein MAINTENANCE OF PSII UNDER HIGH LIGHT 1 n=1 Tax=Sesamum calycinum TaxID=2727403 RepID=A0AAW2SXG1_9LAMI
MMACALYGNSCAISAPANSTRSLLFNKSQPKKRQSVHYCCVRVRAASEDADDCNTEECAPDKEPAVYIAESAISSGTAGSSSDGAENTAAIAAGIALISVAAASSILLQVGKNPPVVQTAEYSGPSLSYYINKFTPAEIIEASAPPPESSTALQTETSAQEVSQPEVQVEPQQETAPSDSTVS